jgi:Ulp1 family protease
MFNTKFYKKMLEEDGVKKVTNWTTKWDSDVFHKKMLFIPIQGISLVIFIVCNAGNVD